MPRLLPAVSTGALAPGDIPAALAVLRGAAAHRPGGALGVELSALHEDELPQLAAATTAGPLDDLGPVTLHGPAKGRRLPEGALVGQLAALGLPTVMHADVLEDPAAWRPLGAALLVENSDHRKAAGQRPADLDPIFAACPQARLCLDVSHALAAGGRALVLELAGRYRDRIAQLHVGCAGGRPAGPVLEAELLALAAQVAAIAGRDLPAVVERSLRGPAAATRLASAVAAVAAAGLR